MAMQNNPGLIPRTITLARIQAAVGKAIKVRVTVEIPVGIGSGVVISDTTLLAAVVGGVDTAIANTIFNSALPLESSSRGERECNCT